MSKKAHNKNMAPEDIKKALKNARITPSGIARDLNRSTTQIHRVIHGEPSHPVRSHIAKCIGKDVKEIWPETYLLKDDPTKKGRPISRGLFSTRPA